MPYPREEKGFSPPPSFEGGAPLNLSIGNRTSGLRVRQLWTPTLAGRASHWRTRGYVPASAPQRSGENRKSCRSCRAFPFASPRAGSPHEFQDGGRKPGSWARPELPLPSSKPAALSPPPPPPPRSLWFSPPAGGPCSCVGGEREDQVSGTTPPSGGTPPFSDLTSLLPPDPPSFLDEGGSLASGEAPPPKRPPRLFEPPFS